jgi:hypothetical protein
MKTTTIIASGALLLCLSLLGAKAASKPSCQQHCNGRFGYCLDYPASLFPNTFISTDEDSLVFKTADMLGELTVIGTETDAKLDSHQAFEQRLRALTSSGGQANILSIINGDDYYEVSFLYDGHWYHQKAGFFQKYDVLYTLRVPVNRTELMVRLKEDVDIEF